jgi:3-hydroxyisobutyrate dehydrogenase-like beta-hydroxyacid dehydrogenase
MAAVGLVGLGAMGSRMARRLLDAGHELTVWNRSASRAEPLADAGAAVAESPAEAARAAEVVLIMVRDGDALAAVTEGPDGVVSGLPAGAAVIQMSTVGPPAIERLAREVRADSLLDAPVLGSISEVEQGTLNVFASGPESLVERWAPLLSVLGRVRRVGPLGAGTASKLVANSTLVGVIGVLGEALALAEGLRLPRNTAFDVLATTALSAQAERRRSAFESGEYPPRFALALAHKDADLILEAAAAAGIEVRLAAAARAWLADAESSGRGQSDYSAVLAEIVGRVSPSAPA